MKNIGNNFYIMLITLFYLSLVLIFYFRKNKLNNTENKVYSYLLFTSLCELVLNMLASLLAYFDTTHGNNICSSLIVRFYLVSCSIWIILFTFYIVAISLKRRKYIHLTAIYVNIILILILFSMLVLPISFNETTDGFFASGLAVSISYGVGGICLLVCFYFMSINLKNIHNKKYWPLYAFGCVCLFIGCIQYFFPTLLLISSAEAFVSIMMYFTLENPDLKVIQEYQSNKNFTKKVDQEKFDFLKNLSHDIDEPIRQVVKSCNILKTMTKNDQELECINKIFEDAMVSNGMINDVLNVSQIAKNHVVKSDNKYNTKKSLNTLYNKIMSKNSELLGVYVHIDKNLPEYLYGDNEKINRSIKKIFDCVLSTKESTFIDLNINYVINGDVCRLLFLLNLSNNVKIPDELFDEIDADMTAAGGKLIYDKRNTEKSIVLFADQIVAEDNSKEIKEIEKLTNYINFPNVLVVSENNDYLIELLHKMKKFDLNIDSTNLGARCIERVRKNNHYDFILLDEDLKLININEILGKLKEVPYFNSKVYILTRNKKDLIFIKNGFSGTLSRKIKSNELRNLEDVERRK